MVGDRSWWSGQRGLLTALALGHEAAGAVPDGATTATDCLHRALRDAGIAVRRDVSVAGRAVDLVARHADIELAVVVDDPAGDSDGRRLRKVFARLDVIAAHAPVRRVPAWRCLVEPDQVAAELADDLSRLAEQASGSALA